MRMKSHARPVDGPCQDRNRNVNVIAFYWGEGRNTVKTLVLASCLVIGSVGVALAQMPPESQQIGHGPPNSVAAPAMALKDLKPTEPEALGLVPKLTVSNSSGHAIHILPTTAVAAQRAKYGLGVPPAPGGGSPVNNKVNNESGVLLYHAGGSVMPYQLVYVIFWAPAHLQNGGATGFSPLYGTINYLHPAWVPDNSLFDIATQYYQTIGGVTSYVVNAGYFAGYYVDSGALPASGCSDSYTPNNCITDAQIQAEVAHAMTINGWTGGMNKIFILFTSSGEGSCFDSGSSSCAYVQYCAYHGHFSSGGQTVIYANMPYANAATCQGTGTEPNQDVGDIVTSATAHEMIEAATDPLLDAWYDASGNEIGDLCAYNYGANSWTNPANGIKASEFTNGWYWEDQMMYSNHTASCVPSGP
jgi:hypothetical protein